MVATYEIKNYENEETLFLYYNCYYEEFGSEFLEKGKDIVNQARDYIRLLGNRFNGKKIILVVNGIMISSLLFTGGEMALDATYDQAKSLNTNMLEIAQPVNFNKNWYDLSINDIIDIDKAAEVEVLMPDSVKEESKENVKGNVNVNENHVKQDNNVKQNTNNQVKPSTNSPNKVTDSNKTNNTQNKVNDSNNVNNNQTVTTEKPADKQETVVDNKTYVTVYRSSGVVERIELEEYVVGVVAAEMPASFNIEAIKAQSLVARTYALKRMSEGKTLTDTVSTQAYIDVNQMKTKWGSSFNTYYNKIKNAVASTSGEYITYNGKYIDAVYHSTSNGRTEDASYVWGYSIPYLKSVDSHWDLTASSYLRETEKDLTQINSLLGLQIDDVTEINVLERSNSGRINSIQIGDKVLKGHDLYTKLGLRSRDFTIKVDGTKIVFTTKGYGHGVGMSQYGAAGMASEGYSYKQIINHYYQGVQIRK